MHTLTIVSIEFPVLGEAERFIAALKMNALIRPEAVLTESHPANA